MDPDILVWIASAAGFASLIGVLIVLLTSMLYEAKWRRLPAATDLENVVELLQVRREELAQLDDQLQNRRGDLHTQRTEYEDLAARRDAAQARLHELQEELAGLAGRQADIQSARNELAELRTRLAEQERAQAEGRAELEQLARAAERARIQLALLDERQAEVDALQALERTARQQFAEAHNELENIQQRVAAGQEAVQRLHADRETLTSEIPGLEQARQSLELQVNQLRAEFGDARQRLEAVQGQLLPLEAALIEKQERLAQVESDHARKHAHVAAMERELDTLQNQSEQARDELAQLRQEREPLAGEAKSARDELARVRNELAGRREQVADLDAELTRKQALLVTIERELEGKGGAGGAEDASLADLEYPPDCLKTLPRAQTGGSEEQALERVHEHLQHLGLEFPQRILYAFHTALKIATISPLTVLAGISGTGKSQLPRRYAEAMGIHFLKIPVQPRWDSPQDMLGFYNYLEKRYKATELARALVHFDARNWQELARKHPDFRNRLLLVLLDEMNLARVEYYFSEFLSQLEGRPDPGDGDSASEIVLDVGGVGGKSRRIYPGHNLMFVGTMNEDESTQTLSDKVLDRANLLRFPRPGKLADKPTENQSGQPADGYLPAERWHGWRRSVDDLLPSDRQRVTAWINTLNDQLDGLHRPFAHRVNQALLAYVANYPGVLDGIGANPEQRIRDAFADQLDQRILPKLRGIDISDPSLKSNLVQIGELIRQDIGDHQLADAFSKAAHDDGSGRPFVWKGVRREPI